MTVRDGTTELASYGANRVSLGMNSEESVIDMCGGSFQFSTDTDTNESEIKTVNTHLNVNAGTGADLNLNGRNVTIDATGLAIDASSVDVNSNIDMNGTVVFKGGVDWSIGGIGGRVMKLLWAGTLSKGGSVTINDLPYYDVFAFSLDVTCSLIGVRAPGDGAIDNFIQAVAGSDNSSVSKVFTASLYIRNSTKLFLQQASEHTLNAALTGTARQIKRIYGII